MEFNIDEDKLNEEAGKFSLDVAKLFIGGVVLASIVKEDFDPLLLIGIGMVIVLFFILLGFYFLTKSKKNTRNEVRRNYQFRINKRKEQRK